MLRIAVLILVLANAGYYAWSQGMLRGMGWGPAIQSEPQRLQQQIEPQKMLVKPVPPATLATEAAASPAPSASVAASAPASTGTPPAAAASSTAPASSPVAAAPASAPQRTVCLQAGSFDEHQAQTLRAAAQSALTGADWKLESTSVAGRWMVYMGKLADDEAVARKRSELRALQIDYDRPGPNFEPGLSLGRFSTEEAAQRALTQLTSKGVRTARVVVERKEATTYMFKLPAVDDALRARLGGMKSALGGKALQSCS
ncbi:MAG: SPOR domain-containing protein [Burkholderiaceae bacterium]|jgi:hypothetical protein|nr:SPOR domain-containing protein [Burkholderiaceae bacterium]